MGNSRNRFNLPSGSRCIASLAGKQMRPKTRSAKNGFRNIAAATLNMNQAYR